MPSRRDARAPHTPAFGGYRVIESPGLVQDGEPYTVRRSWRERLLTRPWRPLVSVRTIVPQVPYRGFVQVDAHTIVMHPETLRTFQAALAKAEAR